ncbi:MAG: sigma 54-interacting transcriptional regulator [Bryobacterales bacterium]|nr:sigma 54-interacting transcriptional regulator [Bryobacterales bacterium]
MQHSGEDLIGTGTHVPDKADLAVLYREREEFHRTILDSLAEGVLITDHESRILYANARMKAISGYEPEELLGRISYEVLSPRKNWERMRRRLQERLAGSEEDYEHELIRKDGTTSWIRVEASPYRNAAGEIAGTVGAISCIDRQKSLERENEYLRTELQAGGGLEELIGPSAALARIRSQIGMVAGTDASVLIHGESGTGKELVARAVHELSARRGKPLVRVNCAAIPKDLFESEFFGHVRGAFTGAIKDRVGRFELAHGGTLFLDEVGEIPPDLQGKLLRVIQERQFERIGEERTRTVDVRLISATNRPLALETAAGRFRTDLYYRLSVFPLEIPPLRERREDILPLAEHFLRLHARKLRIKVPVLTRAQKDALNRYDWPGNVRELQNVIERAVILAAHGAFALNLAAADHSSPAAPVRSGAEAPAEAGTLAGLKEREKQMIAAALQLARGKIYGSNGAAALLGIRPTTLASKIGRLGLRREDFLHG